MCSLQCHSLFSHVHQYVCTTVQQLVHVAVGIIKSTVMPQFSIYQNWSVSIIWFKCSWQESIPFTGFLLSLISAMQSNELLGCIVKLVTGHKDLCTLKTTSTQEYEQTTSTQSNKKSQFWLHIGLPFVLQVSKGTIKTCRTKVSGRVLHEGAYHRIVGSLVTPRGRLDFTTSS